jgi:hypothetical protein
VCFARGPQLLAGFNRILNERLDFVYTGRGMDGGYIMAGWESVTVKGVIRGPRDAKGQREERHHRQGSHLRFARASLWL